MASTDAAMAAGNEAFLELEFDEAIKQYSKAAEAGVPAAFGRRGAVFLAMKKHQEAMTRDAASSGHDIEVNDAGTSLAVCIAMKNGSEFQYELPLYAAVLPQVQVAVEEYNVEVVLSKRDLVQWPSLEPAKKAMPAAVAAAGSAAPLAPTPVAPAAAAASSTAASEPAASAAAPPKAKAKNWDALEAELDSDEEEDKPQGEAALQALFRQIYEKADPDTRRAMVKSFQTSGGTVLSTNWGEVSAKNYEEERPAPDGATWKKYDK